MKNLQELTGVKTLSKKEQKSIKGGQSAPVDCRRDGDCLEGGVCIANSCCYGICDGTIPGIKIW